MPNDPLVGLLFIGDVVGRAGREAVARWLPEIRRREGVSLVVANGENLAGGFGVTEETAEDLFTAGVDCITSGNHLWDRRESLSFITREGRILRPANYPAGVPGATWITVPVGEGLTAAVFNLQGRVFMHSIDCPFRTGRSLAEELRRESPVVLVDVHAEATSEKMALGWFLDGVVTAVVGSHTHVQTADERILPGGTAYISDAGLTGAFDSVIGMEKEPAIRRFLDHLPGRLVPARKDIRLNAVLVSADARSGRARSIKRIELAQGDE